MIPLSKKSEILLNLLKMMALSVLVLLLSFTIAEANYWEITYAPEEVGIAEFIKNGGQLSVPGKQEGVYEGMQHSGTDKQMILGKEIKRLPAEPAATNFMVSQKPAAQYKKEVSIRSIDVDFAPSECLVLAVDKSTAKPGDTVVFTVSVKTAITESENNRIGTPYLLGEGLEGGLMERSGNVYKYRLELPKDAAPGAKMFIALAYGDVRHAVSNALAVTIQP